MHRVEMFTIAFLVIAALVGVAVVREASLQYASLTTVLVATACALGWILLTTQWIRILRPDQMMVRFFLGGSRIDTVCTDIYLNSAPVNQWLDGIRRADDRLKRKNPDQPDRTAWVTPALFGSVAMVPHPFVIGRVFPTDVLKFPIHISDVFTRDDMHSQDNPVPRVGLEIGVSLQLRLSPLIWDAMVTFPLKFGDHGRLTAPMAVTQMEGVVHDLT